MQKNSFKSEFTQGLIWNYVSVAFMAVGGVVFSFLIGFFYDAATLGYFNKIYAIYAIYSQIGVWGSHRAVTKYVSEYAEQPKIVNKIFSAAIFISFIMSLSAALMTLIIGKGIQLTGKTFIGHDGVLCILIATFFFSINKVILGYFNGLSKMKEYAVFQSLRNILITVCIIFMACMSCPGEKLPYCFAIAEVILLCMEIPSLWKTKVKLCGSAKWIKEVYVFGTSIMPGNLVLELNTKADIVCLTLLLHNDQMLGIYSYAAMFAEGFYQLFVVIRRSIDPKITQSYVNGKLSEYFMQTQSIIKKVGYLLSALVAGIIIIGYNILCVLMKDTSFQAGNIVLVILLISIVLNMKSIVWGNLLSHTGYPVQESVVNIVCVIINIILNVGLIYLFQMKGAAIATGISYFAYAIVQKIFIYKKLKELKYVY